MSRQVWKFLAGGEHSGNNVGLASVFDMELPVGAELLRVAMQDQVPFVWALVDPAAAEREKRYFWWVPTGKDLPGDDSRYIGTIDWGRFVFHLFEDVR